MSDGLTARQAEILKALITEYMETAEPVGSLALEKKYNLGISPATIRSEMASLTKMGYLRQPHTSAGRTPTPLAMKFYINQLMEEKNMSLVDEVKTKERVWDNRSNFDKLMQGATDALAEKTHSLAIGATDDGVVWKAGFANVFESPEFYNLQVCQNLFSCIEETKRIHELFFEKLTGLSLVEVLFGEELAWPFFDQIGVVGTRFQARDRQGAIGVIGPFRLRYETVIPTVRYFRSLIEELTK
jgi:heat-inducible transcriptional repressor